MISLSISRVVLSALQVWWGVFSTDPSPMGFDSPASPGYECQAPVWVKNPQWKQGDLYLAEIRANCVIHPQRGGDFNQLAAFAVDQIKKQATVHKGPVSEIFEGMPAQYFDATVAIHSKDSVTIRQNVNIATDATSKFVSSSESTNVQGTGYGEYLKRLDSRLEVLSANSVTDHPAQVSFYAEVEKPWYAPEGMFLDEIQKRVPDQFAKVRDRLVSDLAKNY